MTDSLFSDSRFVWLDAQGKGRNVFALFRWRFHLAEVPNEATFHLFADTRYRLRCNGTVQGYGPARFVPEYPEFDTYDIAPFLVPGENVLTVEVNRYGTTSAEAVSGGQAGFIAAGRIGDLNPITPGRWKVRQVNDAWDAHAIKASFIQNAVEVCDSRRLDPTWFRPGFDDSDWTDPVQLENQGYWGDIQARTIPPYRDRVDLASSIDLVASLRDDEEQIGCRVFDPTWETYKKLVRNHFIYAVWLHSPTAQVCTLGGFWGPHYINGMQIEGEDDPERGDRQNFSVNLKQGWNLLYGEPQMISETWALLIGLPRSAGLTARAEPDFACPEVLKHSGHLSPDALKAVREAIPKDQFSLEALQVDWYPVTRQGFCPHPARRIRWDRILKVEEFTSIPAFPMECLLAKHRMWVVIMDMGREFHGRLVLEIEGPTGTEVDVLYEEQKRPDGLAGRLQYEPADPADSYVLRGGRQLIEGFRTNGGRYVQLALRGPHNGTDGEVVIHHFGIRSAEVPVQMKGSFACGDPIINWAWQSSKDTFEVCQSDVYLPDVWRERGLAVADNRLSTFINRFLDTDMRVGRRSVGMFLTGLDFYPGGILNPYMPSEAVGPHCEFSLIWPIWVADHWKITGDDDLVRQALPVMERILRGTAWQAAESGLWDAEPYTPFIDWGATAEHQHAEENACLNAYRIAAIDCLSMLYETVLMDELQAKKWDAEAERLRRAFRQRLWIADEQRFAVGSCNGSKWIEPPSPHANILALRFGLVPEGQECDVVDYLEVFARTNLQLCLQSSKHRQGTITLLFLHYLMEVCYDWNRPALAEYVLREHWDYMRGQGAWTIWEKLTSTVPSSQCHVWGATPIIHAGRNILGIRQFEPGSERHFVIEPSAASLPWAEGRYPLTDGNELRVAWEVRSDLLEITVTAPAEVMIQIAPRGPLADLRQRHIIKRN